MTNYTRVQIRRGTAANWAADNPILANGEQALETDTLQTKFGDGITHYNSLPYQDRQGPTGPTGPRGATGPIGAKGDTGSFGGAIFTYNYLTDTTDSNPGTGNLKFDNTLTTATHLFINKTDLAAVDNGPYLETIDDSTSSIKGHFKVEVVGNTNQFVYYAITGNHYLDESLYYEVPIMYLSGSITTLADNADVTITFVRTGDKGDKGDTGNAATLTLGAVATGDPGTSASVSNSGDTYDAVFDFTIPQGPTGPVGPVGPTGPTVIDWHGPWSSGTTYAKNSIVSYSGKTYISTDISYPPEDNTKTPLTISTWQLFTSNGDKGDTGNAATVSVGTVSSTGPNSSPSVSNSGTTSAAILNFVIPIGATGASGIISVTGPITNAGSSTSAVIGINQSSLTISESQVTNLVSDLNLKAPKASPTFTGNTSIANLAMGTALSISGSDYVSGSPYTSSIAFGGGTLYANGNRLATYDQILNYPINYTSSNTRTIDLSDMNKLLIMNDATMNYVYVPLNSTTAFPLGFQMTLTSYNTGRITVVPISGVTINATPGLLTRTRYSTATLVKTGSPDTWLLYGDLTA